MNWISIEKQLPPKTRDEILFNISGVSDHGTEGSYIVFAQYCEDNNYYYWAYHPAYCRKGKMAMLSGCHADKLGLNVTHWMSLELPKGNK